MSRQATVKKNLRHSFTPAELQEMGSTLASKIQKLSELDDDKKASAKDYGSRIESVQGEINKITGAINSRFEMADIECRIDYDTPEPGKRTIIRTDTEEVVSVEKMTDSEMQLELPLLPEETTAPSLCDACQLEFATCQAGEAATGFDDRDGNEIITACTLHIPKPEETKDVAAEGEDAATDADGEEETEPAEVGESQE